VGVKNGAPRTISFLRRESGRLNGLGEAHSGVGNEFKPLTCYGTAEILDWAV